MKRAFCEKIQQIIYFSTIKCGCQWPFQPCALCTGRADPTAPRDPLDTMMKAERIALLDPCFHPVLSFPEGKYQFDLMIIVYKCYKNCSF